MRISEIHITPVAVPDPPLLNAAGLHAPYALRIIIEMVSADGISGWGEIPGSEATRAALELTAEHIIGMDPWGLNAIAANLESLANPDDRGATPWDQRTWVHVKQRYRSRLLRPDGQVDRAARRRPARRPCA